MGTCSTCRFSEHFVGVDVLGCERRGNICRRNAPIGEGIARWPMVREEDWCGEYSVTLEAAFVPEPEVPSVCSAVSSSLLRGNR